MAEVFLPYARTMRPRVEQISDALEEGGYSPWRERAPNALASRR